MKDELAKRFIAAAQRFEREVKEAAKEFDDEDYRTKMEELGDTVLRSTKDLVAIMDVLSRLFDEDDEKGGGK